MKKPPPKPQAWPMVPRLCPGGTVLCIASGPSLTTEDVQYALTRVDASIVINTSYQLAPAATALYAADAKWWKWHKGAPDFAGLKYSLTRDAAKWPGVQVLKRTGDQGLDLDPSALRTGKNSGYQAINLAVHFGARRIVLLGYDMHMNNGRRHWHGDHPDKSRSAYGMFLAQFPSIVKPLRAHGVEVVNCTRDSALTVFPRLPLAEALP